MVSRLPGWRRRFPERRDRRRRLIAIAAVARFHQAEWVNLLLGLRAIAAPRLPDFAALTGAVAVHVIVGVAVAAVAA